MSATTSTPRCRRASACARSHELAGAAEGEAVVFSFIVYESREHRDKVNAKVMADPRMAQITPQAMPFDSTRMAWGGFRAIVEKRRGGT